MRFKITILIYVVWYQTLRNPSRLKCHCARLNFIFSCILFQGGDQVDLVPGGASIDVTSSNVHDYVRKYAEYRMCKAPEKALEVSGILNFTFKHSWLACHSLVLIVTGL